MNDQSDEFLMYGSVADNLTIDYAAWHAREKPHGISACIRLRNESQFMRAAVRSILPVVDEAVLVVQPSDDNTREIAMALEVDYPDKVRALYYPLVPDWIDTPGFYAKDPDEPGHMVHMSNWALSHCRYDWILKVEGDVIGLPTLAQFAERVRSEPPARYYGLVILNVAGPGMDMVSWENPRNGGWDEAFFPNDPNLCRFYRRNKWEVAVPSCESACLGWALLHMKRCKVGKDAGWNNEHYISWDRDLVDEALRNYAGNTYPGEDRDPFGHRALYGGEWKQYL